MFKWGLGACALRQDVGRVVWDCDRVLLDIEARVVCVDGKGDGLIGMLSV